MGPIQSGINSTIGLLSGLKKLGNIEKGVEKLDPKVQEFVETAQKKYGLSEKDAIAQGKKFFELAQQAEGSYKELANKMAPVNFDPQQSEVAMQRLAQGQEAKTALQQQAEAYRQAIREREEQTRITTYQFNPNTNETNKTTEVKR